MATDRLGHILVSWGCQFEKNREVPLYVEDRLLAQLAGHAFVRPHANAVVVTLTYDDERDEIVRKLTDVLGEREANIASADDEFTDNEPMIGLIVSPAIPTGNRYQGWLESDIWDKINKRSG